jgi:hypothetical protein
MTKEVLEGLELIENFSIGDLETSIQNYRQAKVQIKDAHRVIH